MRFIVLAVCLLTAGCQGTGIDLSGGISEIMKRGVHFSYSWATVTVPEVHPPRSVKIGGPP